jgi:hypothetical protein
MAVKRAASLVEFANARRREDGTIEVPKSRPRSKTIAASRFSKTIAETRAMLESGDWEGFAARHVLALYDLMHEKCYLVAPVMTSGERHRATLAAGLFVKNVFGGVYDDAVEYFRWLWDREIDRQEWRKRNAKPTNPMAFYWTISTRIVTDYRVHQANNPKGRA